MPAVLGWYPWDILWGRVGKEEEWISGRGDVEERTGKSRRRGNGSQDVMYEREIKGGKMNLGKQKEMK